MLRITLVCCLLASGFSKVTLATSEQELSQKVGKLIHDAEQNQQPILNPTSYGDGQIFIVPSREDRWQFTGDVTDWKPHQMQRIENYLWIYFSNQQLRDKPGYKLFNNGTYQADAFARTFYYDVYGEISYVSIPKNQPVLIRHFIKPVDSRLKPRFLRVFKPAGEGPFPVIYMHDGQNLFDPNAPYGSWDVQNQMRTQARKAIVVGIDNTMDRMTEYTFTSDMWTTYSDGDLYADFIIQQVIPWTEATFQTTNMRAVMGSSLGGLVSLYIAYRYPNIFDYVISMSGTLGWGKFKQNKPTIHDLFQTVPDYAFKIYLDSGGGPGFDGICSDIDGDGITEDDPENRDNYCETNQFFNIYKDRFNIDYQWAPGESHSEIAWNARLPHIFGQFLWQ